uniref:Uncharacterized protein n=1 Tax=Arundo donax TaxID=35708 RepID=A0A0A9G8D3_ARUDO
MRLLQPIEISLTLITSQPPFSPFQKPNTRERSAPSETSTPVQRVLSPDTRYMPGTRGHTTVQCMSACSCSQYYYQCWNVAATSLLLLD